MNLISLEMLEKTVSYNLKLMSELYHKFAEISSIDVTTLSGKYEDEYAIVHYKNAQIHRDDGPAIEFSNGAKHWYLNGIRHRENGPAIEGYNGYKAWYLKGRFIRSNNLPTDLGFVR